jgi:hypothetical protein
MRSWWLAATGGVLIAAVSAATPAVAASTPHVRISPRSGPVGSLVTLTGHLTSAQRNLYAKADSVTAFIAAGQPHAGLETSLPGQLTVAADGAMRLTFTLPASATWAASPMSGVTDRLAATPAPATLQLAWPCRACDVGTFQVTAASTLPFTGSSDRALAVLAAVLMLTGAAALAAASHEDPRRSPAARSIG